MRGKWKGKQSYTLVSESLPASHNLQATESSRILLRPTGYNIGTKKTAKHTVGHFLFFSNSIKSCRYHHSKWCFLHVTMQQIACESCERHRFRLMKPGSGSWDSTLPRVSHWVIERWGHRNYLPEESFTVNGFYTWESTVVNPRFNLTSSQNSIIHRHTLSCQWLFPLSRCTSRVREEIPFLLSRHNWRVFRSCYHRRDVCKYSWRHDLE